MGGDNQPDKGVFGKPELPVAKSYLYPEGRNRLLLAVGLLGLVAAALFAGDAWLRQGRLISSGPLTSAHADFEDDCQSCHSSFEPVADKKCLVCHEKYGADPALHGFDSHYVYRSGDLSRAFRRDGETACFDCHPEHAGRSAVMTLVSDDKCLSCHDFGSFDSRHPQFEFLADGLADDSKLAFTHIRHVQNVRRERTIDDIEEACLFCHQPSQDGKSFEPIDFEQICQSCHLGPAQRVQSATLDVREAGQPLLDSQGNLKLGVESLQTIRSRQGPGELWALESSPAEFRERGGTVTKMRLYHQDPWILHNLRMLRRTLYPEAGLADLLRASPQVAAHQGSVLYREAAQTLRKYLSQLQGQASDRSAMRELVELDQLLAQTEARIRQGDFPADDSRFLLPPVNPRLDDRQVRQIEDYAHQLSEACLKCHSLEEATIARVQKDQRVLRRAEFNHRLHVLQRRCLDCHQDIPFLDFIGPLAASDKSPEEDPSADNAAIQNIPGIEACQSCHRSGRVSNSCVTCHRFHPDQRSQARLLLHSGQGGIQ